MTIDIIVPTYNRSDILSETLESVQAQTYSDWVCWVAFLGDDDVWLPEKLEYQLTFTRRHPNCVLLGSNAYLWDGTYKATGSRMYFYKRKKREHISYKHLLRDNRLITSSVYNQWMMKTK